MKRSQSAVLILIYSVVNTQLKEPRDYGEQIIKNVQLSNKPSLKFS